MHTTKGFCNARALTGSEIQLDLHSRGAGLKFRLGVGRATAASVSVFDPLGLWTVRGGGKSGLLRAGCQITSGRREPTESATENIPPAVWPQVIRG